MMGQDKPLPGSGADRCGGAFGRSGVGDIAGHGEALDLGGNAFGRIIGVIGGTLGAIGALLSVGGAYPWWSLAIFALCVWVTWGIIVFGEDENAGY